MPSIIEMIRTKVCVMRGQMMSTTVLPYVNHLRATEHHLAYGITHYLSLDTGERAPLLPQKGRLVYSTYLPRRLS